MTAATYRRISPRGGAPRCAWVAVVALLAALAVLVHHDVAVSATPATAMSAMPAMDHTATTAPATAPTGPGEAARVEAAAPAMDHDDGGACSGSAMQHCSSGDVSTPQLLAPPSALPRTVRSSSVRSVLAGHGPSGISHRAPPDLSLLSRLLI
ncbi:hypothetical protein ACGF5O_15000 [Streptomyces sp. NPDC048291]|uniref:hypothetical protein n=1 Tax=Streptomyces sp. NPDC048291 TaxID=3365530 RepID=UPI0037214CE9